ncbi:EcsC family protein [Paenibacillus sp. FSL E2-0201]|uniref:EcsC family protein n=1 Tax=Paenibacillus sp. FSL E2-0201 TaxID=2954726 RepID=UPI0030DCA276
MHVNSYDTQSLITINKWKNPPKGWLMQKFDKVKAPLNSASDFIMDNAVGEAVNKSLMGIISTLNDGAAWSVQTEIILKEYREKGCVVNKHSDIHNLSLKTCDKVVGYLGAKYKSIALAEGGGAGLLGAPGMLVDIPALFALNLRAVAEYATYYGFDVDEQHEREYIINVLMYTSSPSLVAKQTTLAELSRIAVMVSKNKTWEQINKSVLAQGIVKAGESIGMNITKDKLGQAIPVVGALIGAGYNAYFTNSVCEAAYNLYRERFLAVKYGEEIYRFQHNTTK